MKKTKIKDIVLLLALGIMVLVSGCQNMHFEVPVSMLNTIEDIEVTLETIVDTLEAEANGESLDTEETVNTDEDVQEATEEVVNDEPAFKVVNDIRICKNINFDTSDTISTVYLVENNNITQTDIHTDMTQIEQSAVKFRFKDSSYEVWAYINTNGALRERPWENNIITTEMMAVYPTVVDSLSTENYTGSYTQVAVTKALEDGEEGATITSYYNDTYVTKGYGSTLIALHITAARQGEENTELLSTSIVSNEDINRAFATFQFVDNTEVKVEVKEFNFKEPISFVEEERVLKEDKRFIEESTEESAEEQEIVESRPSRKEEYEVVEKVLNSITTSDMGAFPFNISDKVVEGGQTLNAVDVPDKPGMLLRLQNTDVIYKSIKQCKLLSLNYDFTEDINYDIRLFGYLKANSKLEDIQTDILSYDNYYINEEGTGYIVYKLGRWDIRSITTYYVMDRLSGLVVEFD